MVNASPKIIQSFKAKSKRVHFIFTFLNKTIFFVTGIQLQLSPCDHANEAYAVKGEE
jgi:hypothetical protein